MQMTYVRNVFFEVPVPGSGPVFRTLNRIQKAIEYRSKGDLDLKYCVKRKFDSIYLSFKMD